MKQERKAVFVISVYFRVDDYNFLSLQLQNRVLLLMVMSPNICLV